MNYPPIFQLAAASPAVTALLGTNQTRLFLFGRATQGTTKPYAVWQTIYGNPENYINQRPDIDNWGTQVDVYASTAAQSRQVAKALMDAWEGAAHVVQYNGDFQVENTEPAVYRFSFTVEWYTNRI